MKESSATEVTGKEPGRPVKVLGIDLAKNIFSLHGVDERGNVVLKRRVSREKLTELVATLPPCLIGLEACSGAHHFARVFAASGHTVRPMAAQFVSPYRQSGKNDGNDAQAICEAVARPHMRFVPVKTPEQQGQLVLHRTRSGFVEERTATINRARGLAAEFGIVLPQSAEKLCRLLPPRLAAETDALPVLAKQALSDLLAHLRVLDARILDYDRQIAALIKNDARAERLRAVTGIGPLTASAALATVGDAMAFRNGRQFAAFLGLTPRQHSTGGRTVLGRITKRGDAYLRTLLVHGARSALQTAHRRHDRLSRWMVATEQRIGYHKTLVAIANKHARILWALLAKGTAFDINRFGERPKQQNTPA